MKTLKLSIFAAIVAVALSGCAGKDGAPGATGPQGPTGNANVFTSTTTALPGNWTGDGNGGWYTSASISGIDPTQGACNTYWSSDDVAWTALPYTGTTPGAPVINFTFNSNTITWYYDPQTGAGSIAGPTITYYFKVVIIPPAVMKAHPNTNWNNYSEVKHVLNLAN